MWNLGKGGQVKENTDKKEGGGDEKGEKKE